MRKVALVAASFRMPGTTSQRFWEDLLAGRDLITEVEPERWARATYLHPDRAHPGCTYTFAAGSIGDVSGFDAGFFAISPREAALMDPQQRLLLEMGWETLENANLPPSRLRGSDCGVYIGVASSEYSWRMSDDLGAIDTSFATGNAASIAANRLSYFFDLRGPSMAIDTACSSSLVAFHQACRAIACGEISQALAGAVTLHLHPLGFVSFSKATMLSRRGRCRVFDAAADGYVRSEGGGIFLLKDLERAIADGNPILAVVAASAVNTDGHKAGLTVPSHAAQAALLRSVYRNAGIGPEEIDYIEAHGTGTAVGDPIETRALSEALAQHRPQGKPLLVGSIKGNLGHLEAAAGVAGILKALHCLQHRIVPAQIGIEALNPHIPLAEWNLAIPNSNTPLRPSGRLVIGVNSFGFGGANAHVVLENHLVEHTPRAALPQATIVPLVVSARDPAALRGAAQSLADLIAGHSRAALYDIAYQSVLGRELHEHRAVAWGTRPESLAQGLAQFAREGVSNATVEVGDALDQSHGAVFVYSGNGAQWPGMGRLLLADPVFRGAVREVDELFSRYVDYSLEEKLEGQPGGCHYERTEIAQPALFAVQVGITAMLRQRGLVPIAVVGHSVGEVAAAWASGALSLAAAVNVIYHRSALQETTRGLGSMSALALDETRARALLGELSPEVVVASANSPRACTIAGPLADLERLERVLGERGIAHKRLDLDYPFHTESMDALAGPLQLALAHLEPEDSSIDFHSTVTGERLPGRALGASYWWRNIREPVSFAAAIRALIREGLNIFVEVGPHPVLRRHIQDTLAELEVTGRVIATGLRAEDSPQRIYTGASEALIAGARMDWKRVLPQRARQVQLPNYAWQRERHWHPLTAESLGQLERHPQHPLLGHVLRQAEGCWQSTVDTQRLPYLKDHAVGGAVVFPGTAYVELALALAVLGGAEATVYAIEDLEIRAPMTVGATPSRLVRSSLDPRDGQLTIRSREQQREEPWTLHATGRVMSSKSTEVRLPGSPCTLPSRPPDFTGALHAELTRAVGLEYGPAFQAIEHGWLEGSTVLATLCPPASADVDFAGYYLHPTLADCALQLVMEALSERVELKQMTFVPVRVGRATFRPGLGPPRYARAELKSASLRSIAAHFSLFDAELRPVALLEDVRFQSIRVQRPAADGLRYLHYEAVPRPRESPASERFSDLSRTLGECFSLPEVQSAQHQYAAEVEPLLDQLCARFGLDALERTQFVAPEAKRFHEHLQTLAETDRLVEATEKSLVSAEEIWNSLIGDYPHYVQTIHAVGCIGLHLRALLEGTRTLADVQPERHSPACLLQETVGLPLLRALSTGLKGQIEASLDHLGEGSRVEILEVSSSGPVLGEELCRTLDFDRVGYTFRGDSVASLDEGRRLREKHPAIDIARHDENAATAHAHLGIVWLDHSAPRQARSAIDGARERLLPGGLLLLVGQRPARWLDFVFGRDPAWWDNALGEERSGRPPSAWEDVLSACGFECMRTYEHGEYADAGGFVILARCPARSALPATPTEQGTWCLLGGDTPYTLQLTRALEERLRAAGQSVIDSLGGPRDEPLRGLIDLRGIEVLAAEASAEAAFEAQLERCAPLLDLARSAHRPAAKLVCLVTSNATIHLLPGRKHAVASAVGALEDAPRAALARVWMNEPSGQRVLLVDIETAGAEPEVIAAALARELLEPDEEGEILLTARGERFVPRLRPMTPHQPDLVQRTIGEPSVTRLGFSSPGQLRNLQWERHPAVAPQGDEVEVAVHATGVNFRDVMYALGLLSDEAVEDGFAGPTLGLEFSGVVTRVGRRATEFSLGDRVVGFAPSSYSDRLITPSRAIALMPNDLSFESAATLPSAFFTAYYALRHLAHLREGERVLIHGAAGGVGMAAIQIAKWCGAEVYGTAGTPGKRDFLALLGVDHIFDSRSLAFADQILDQTRGEGVDVVLNSLAGEAINRNLKLLRPFGRFLELGKRDFYENNRIGLRPFRRNLSYFGIDADQLMSQQPELTQRLFREILELFRNGVLRPLPYQRFEAAEVVDAFRHMQQSRHLGKIIVTYRNGLPPPQASAPSTVPPLSLPVEATYLVTGGLSGLGLQTACWLVERGARHLVLVGRRGAETSETIEALARLQAQGAEVWARTCDVTSRSALRELLGEVSRELPPLRGVVHAAMVIEDALLRDVSLQQLRLVGAPKMLGALLLDELTADAHLDFFVMYSSATTLFGNPGQGSYIAANCGLEALARRRRARGLPATCVLLGAIEDVGFLARHRKLKDALTSRTGGSAMPSAQALAALERMLLAGDSGCGALNFDWRALKRSLPSARSPKFAELARGIDTEDSPEGSGSDLRVLLAQLSPEALLDKVVEVMKVEIGEILRLPAAKIDERLHLQQLGLDSLMGVELAVALESRFGIRPPALVLSESPTIHKLATWLARQLRGEEADSGDELRSRISRLAEQHASDVSASEIERVASELIDTGTESRRLLH